MEKTIGQTPVEYTEEYMRAISQIGLIQEQAFKIELLMKKSDPETLELITTQLEKVTGILEPIMIGLWHDPLKKIFPAPVDNGYQPMIE